MKQLALFGHKEKPISLSFSNFWGQMDPKIVQFGSLQERFNEQEKWEFISLLFFSILAQLPTKKLGWKTWLLPFTTLRRKKFLTEVSFSSRRLFFAGVLQYNRNIILHRGTEEEKPQILLIFFHVLMVLLANSALVITQPWKKSSFGCSKRLFNYYSVSYQWRISSKLQRKVTKSPQLKVSCHCAFYSSSINFIATLQLCMHLLSKFVNGGSWGLLFFH